ncbi:sporulation histidine kinase inhibitor Sda [Paenibacillus glycanilyticus]|uniref:sporulation histidine kinase inhibitor Sda n=1 Tax=Paenibacillus glycanilyticus TaxID=126569 RepID=UPI003EBB1C42
MHQRRYTIRLLDSVDDSFLLHLLESASRIDAHPDFITIILEELQIRNLKPPLYTPKQDSIQK